MSLFQSGFSADRSAINSVIEHVGAVKGSVAEFGALLGALIKEQGRTTTSVAKDTGLSVSRISAIVKGGELTSFDEVHSISKFIASQLNEDGTAIAWERPTTPPAKQSEQETE